MHLVGFITRVYVYFYVLVPHDNCSSKHNTKHERNKLLRTSTIIALLNRTVQTRLCKCYANMPREPGEAFMNKSSACN